MKRNKTDFIIIHCTDTKCDMRYDVKAVDRWHWERGFKGIGYHFLVMPDGTVQGGRPMDEVGAHCAKNGMNRRSIGVCYVGGRDANNRLADTRTEAQKQSLRQLLKSLLTVYPQAKIRGHCQFDPMKSCPNFDAEQEYADL